MLTTVARHLVRLLIPLEDLSSRPAANVELPADGNSVNSEPIVVPEFVSSSRPGRNQCSGETADERASRKTREKREVLQMAGMSDGAC